MSEIINLSDDLVQITASNNEIQQRIERFMKQKRDIINRTNLLDFCVSNSTNPESEVNSCARVDAVLVRRKNSKSHLKISRVYNVNGPLTSSITETVGPSANPVDERLQNLEQHLLVNQPIPTDIYERIKQIEARVLELESMSPEYCQFWKNAPSSSLPPMERVLMSHNQNKS